ncbi:lipoprotein insertase outer membrane protein LolB [Algibacillus agarilyticus]|uniref:lipoprotein insertase outer membrane protein LolB n=1 Tax=Algibacillus agarilyticus TaxID=2234133 RepID=UPI000DD0E5D2|nr:lipoprotein insertase outer membrane protein LolB [Algibacillus agarilyticus]
MIKLYTIALLCFFLISCVNTPEEIKPTHYTHIKQIKNFTIKGKAAFISPQKKESLNFFWQQKNDQYDIKFTTFMGIEVAHITGNNRTINIVADGETYTSTQPEQLLNEITGWDIPLRYLARWITGNHSGVVLDKHIDINQPKHVLARINAEQEWKLEYQAYYPYFKLLLPKKMQLKQYNSRIILSINYWRLD